MPESLFSIKLQVITTLRKEIPTEVFSCDFCEIFQNTYFVEHLQMAASIPSNFHKHFSSFHDYAKTRHCAEIECLTYKDINIDKYAMVISNQKYCCNLSF